MRTMHSKGSGSDIPMALELFFDLLSLIRFHAHIKHTELPVNNDTIAFIMDPTDFFFSKEPTRLAFFSIIVSIQIRRFASNLFLGSCRIFLQTLATYAC